MVMDMTTGDPIKRILKFFLPVMLGNLLQQFYSMADSIIVSRYLGVDAFSGVSATGSLNFLILGFALGLCSGFAIPVSQEFGAGDYSAMRRCFANGIIMAAVIAAVMAVVTGLLSPQILRLMGTPENIFPYSLTYIRLIFFGIPATVLYNLLSGVLRAVGDGRTSLYMLLCSTVLNIILDLLFVVTFNMGIAGAAAATVLAQLVSGLLCMGMIYWKFDILHIQKDEWTANAKIMRRLLGIGVPMGLQFSVTAVGSTILQASVNSLGSQAVAAVGAGAKVQFVFTTPLEAVGVTMATYCGQNLGARRFDRVRVGVRRITLISFFYCIFAFAVQSFVGRWIALLFIDSSEVQILDMATHYLNIMVATSFLLAIVLIYRNSIQGLGFSRVAMFAGLMELVGRVFVALVLVKAMGFNGACFANPTAWLCADLFLLPVYFWSVKRLETQEAKDK
ncbi:MAG: MATE family efflux transporter [Acutalibacter sp.]|nr:MATE family efflux transporter [Acutalibacter sp.]